MTTLCALVVLGNAAIFGLGVWLWNLRADPKIQIGPRARGKLIFFAVLLALVYCLLSALFRAVWG